MEWERLINTESLSKYWFMTVFWVCQMSLLNKCMVLFILQVKASSFLGLKCVSVSTSHSPYLLTIFSVTASSNRRATEPGSALPSTHGSLGGAGGGCGGSKGNNSAPPPPAFIVSSTLTPTSREGAARGAGAVIVNGGWSRLSYRWKCMGNVEN